MSTATIELSRSQVVRAIIPSLDAQCGCSARTVKGPRACQPLRADAASRGTIVARRMASKAFPLSLPFWQQSAVSLKREHLVFPGRHNAYFRRNGHYWQALARTAIFAPGEKNLSVAVGGPYRGGAFSNGRNGPNAPGTSRPPVKTGNPGLLSRRHGDGSGGRIPAELGRHPDRRVEFSVFRLHHCRQDRHRGPFRQTHTHHG